VNKHPRKRRPSGGAPGGRTLNQWVKSSPARRSGRATCTDTKLKRRSWLPLHPFHRCVVLRPVPRVTGRDFLILNTERYRVSVGATQTIPNCSTTEDAGPGRTSAPAPLDRPLNACGGAASSLSRQGPGKVVNRGCGLRCRSGGDVLGMSGSGGQGKRLTDVLQGERFRAYRRISPRQLGPAPAVGC
jgi:hypothetical protein